MLMENVPIYSDHSEKIQIHEIILLCRPECAVTDHVEIISMKLTKPTIVQ